MLWIIAIMLITIELTQFGVIDSIKQLAQPVKSTVESPTSE